MGSCRFETEVVSPHGVWSVRRARVKVLGRATEGDAVVTAYDPPRFAALKGTSASASFEATLAFEPVDGGTRVGVETIFHLSGPIGPLFVGSYDRGWDRGLANLKRMMESGEL